MNISRALYLLPLLSILSTPLFAGEKVFLDSIISFDADKVRLPLYQGMRGEEVIYYIITDTSDGDLEDEFGVPKVNKLDNARGTAAVQGAHFNGDGELVFTASVDFSPERVVQGSVTGFPPLVAEPGAIAEEGYSPLVELPNGAVVNAPHVANSSGVHDSVITLNIEQGYVDMELVDGFARGKEVLYISTESSSPVGAALEGATYAPALNAAPGLGDDSSSSSRASLAAITNGQTGVDNDQRQGLNSALLGEGDPLNILAWLPNQGRYSPLWDVHLSTFSGVGAELQDRFADIEDLAEDGDISAPDGSDWGASGFVVNCPIMVRVR